MDDHSSKELIQIKKFTAQSEEDGKPCDFVESKLMMADKGAMKSGKNLSMTISKGEKVTIAFPV